jgi:competence ComEA-like helix-hairpin-helix protein
MDYTSLTARERKGIFILCALFLLIFCTPTLIHPKINQKNGDEKMAMSNSGNYENIDSIIIDKENDNTQNISDNANQDKKGTTHNNKHRTGEVLGKNKTFKKSYKEKDNSYINCLPFDPNLISTDTLLLFGLPQYVVNNINAYRNNNGRFRRKEDLRKIYGLKSDEYEKLAPCIVISVGNNTDPVDINVADIEQMESLHGIGPVLAERIIKFRNRLGGFYSISQIGETYGLSEETFENIKSKLKISGDVKKVDLNRSESRKLAAHPYISYKQAKTITQYRIQHGDFKSVDQLNLINVLDSAFIHRIRPYLDVN